MNTTNIEIIDKEYEGCVGCPDYNGGNAIYCCSNMRDDFFIRFQKECPCTICLVKSMCGYPCNKFKYVYDNVLHGQTPYD